MLTSFRKPSQTKWSVRSSRSRLADAQRVPVPSITFPTGFSRLHSPRRRSRTCTRVQGYGSPTIDQRCLGRVSHVTVLLLARGGQRSVRVRQGSTTARTKQNRGALRRRAAAAYSDRWRLLLQFSGQCAVRTLSDEVEDEPSSGWKDIIEETVITCFSPRGDPVIFDHVLLE